MKKYLSVIIPAIIFVVGLSVFLYPSVSEYINSRNQSKAVADYENASDNLGAEENARILEAAAEYNARIYEAGNALYNPGSIEGYDNILDISGTGIMGYITIEKLGLELPIYHGTGSGALSAGVGHLEGSSLPVGGANTHACLTAHSGLPGSELFSNLDRLEIGDRFTITVLDRKLVYTVDSILTVTPTEFDTLFITGGEDYCTLITCTPYGVNSHRLLVRGIRME